MKTIEQEMTDLIIERAIELAKNPVVQKRAVQVGMKHGIDEAKLFVYRLAIATLYGMEV